LYNLVRLLAMIFVVIVIFVSNCWFGDYKTLNIKKKIENFYRIVNATSIPSVFMLKIQPF
jgi:hypothetical protein